MLKTVKKIINVAVTLPLTIGCFGVFNKQKRLEKKLQKYNNEKFDIILVAGQSNAQGYGGEFIELKYIPNESILAYDKKKGIKLAEENVINKDTRNFFALSFAKEYLQSGLLSSDRKLLIINVAEGGTGFSDNRWGIGEDLFKRMISLMCAFSKLNAENKFKCLLWHQGETDAINGMSELNYYSNLCKLITNTRQSTNQFNLPFFAGDMVEEWKATEPRTKEIELATRKVVNDLENCYFVESTGLNGNTAPDIIHFNRKSNIELGRRYFAQYQKHLK